MLEVPKTLGHDDVKTTTIYSHVFNHGPSGVCSLADGLWEGRSCADPYNMPG